MPSSNVLSPLSSHIEDRAKIILASSSIGAVGRLQATMDGIKEDDESIGDRQLRYEAAKEILDRVGIHKRSNSDGVGVNITAPVAVVFLPQKDTSSPLPVDLGIVDVDYEEV